jgi:hypothetical protein
MEAYPHIATDVIKNWSYISIGRSRLVRWRAVRAAAGSVLTTTYMSRLSVLIQTLMH